MTAHLMDKGLDMCLEPGFESKLTEKEIGPFDSDNEKEAVELNKKAMGQFIQAFSNIGLLNKVNLEWKADKIMREKTKNLLPWLIQKSGN